MAHLIAKDLAKNVFQLSTLTHCADVAFLTESGVDARRYMPFGGGEDADALSGAVFLVPVVSPRHGVMLCPCPALV